MQEVLEKKVIFLQFFEKQQPKAAADRPDGTGGNTKKVCIGIRKKRLRTGNGLLLFAALVVPGLCVRRQQNVNQNFRR
ncbi:hypothetical protein [Victivallis vadensis]|uniref:hypothetical protein n=1 Tax=Victivallis vadensis TaxID=172901 RepID=UPI000E32A4A5|nr:hypothetical protein [Victivallis vadensis]